MRVPRERQRRKALLVSFFLPTVPVQVTGLGTSDRNSTAMLSSPAFAHPRTRKTSPTDGGSSQHLRRLGLRQQLLQGNEAGLARVRAGHADLVRKGHCVAADHRWDVLLLVVDVLKNLHQDRPKQAL